MTETAEPKAVTIRDVPEEVRARARWLAAVRGTSMNQVLVDALVSGLPTREQILTEAGEQIPAEAGEQILTEAGETS